MFGEEDKVVPWSTLDEESFLDPMVPWMKSTVEAGVLPPKELIGWRAAEGEDFPTPNTGEIVVHTPFFFRGFSVPVHPFLRGLLYFTGSNCITST